MPYKHLFKFSRDILLVVGEDGRIIKANDAAIKAYGYSNNELLSLSIYNLRDDKHVPIIKQQMEKAIDEGILFETVHYRKDNSTFPVEVGSTAIKVNGNNLILSIVRNITERKQTEQSLSIANEELMAANEELAATNEELIATEEELRRNYAELWLSRNELETAYKQLTDIIEFLPDATFILDKDKKIIAWNRAIEKMTGVLKKDILGRGDYAYAIPFHGSPIPGLIDLIEAKDSESENRYQNFVRYGNTLSAEFYATNLNGGLEAYLQIKTSVLYDNKGQLAGAIETIRDITELRHLSICDQVTKLYNRTHFEEELQTLEDTNYTVGLIMLDFDGLKLINDTFGHKTGDEMLAAVAKVLMKSVSKEEKVFRIGGDEFAVLMPQCTRDDLEASCDKIKDNIEIYNQQHQEHPLSISIGNSMREGCSKTCDELFREADDNMYRGKLHRSLSSRSSIVNTLMKALEARDFITEGHADRLQTLVEELGATMGMPVSKLYDLRLFAQFHDIGKVGIPDNILFKPGPLTAAERAEMQRHSEIGCRIAQTAPDLMPIADWVLKHHEWWNGNGYPLGLKGKEIPLECRILAIVDAYDAMSNDRPYRRAMPHEEVLFELDKCAGTQFDPQLVLVFKQLLS